jgi:hypothetical protein
MEMQLWKWLNTTALMAPEGEGNGGKPATPEPDKGSASNPVEYGFQDDMGDTPATDFVIEDGPTKAETVDTKEAREAAEKAANKGDDTAKGGDGDSTVKAGQGDDTAKGSEGDDDPDDLSKLPKGVRRRLERAQRQRDAAVAEAEQLRKDATKPKADDDPAGIENKAPADPPNAADFDDYEAYLEAKALYDKGKKAPPKKAAEPAKPAAEPKAEEKPAAPAKPDTEVVEAITAIGAEMKADHAELWGKVTADGNPLGLTITRDMLIAISDADNPATVLQALADKPELSKEIAKLPASQQIRRITKLDTGAAEPAKDGDKPAPKLSNAPPPITPGSGKGKGEIDPIKDFTTFEREREAEETGRGGIGEW